MNAFDKVIGYETIKTELMQICDMIHNREVYTSLGAKMPQGLLMFGNPGLGKTLMAKCFIEESGLPVHTIRRSKGAEEFVNEITSKFKTAKEHTPCIIFLDDMDKFANEDQKHRDAEEYVAVQAGIDEVKDLDVFVIATVNEIYKLPSSLVRSGRFDRKIEVCTPTQDDASSIIKHFLDDKKVSKEVNLDDIAKMIHYSSCADLETVINEAAINAAYNRRPEITTDDLLNAVLRMTYRAPDNFTTPTEDELKKVALHEAGHLVVCEVLVPGSIGLASLRTCGRDHTGGFVRKCKMLTRRTHDILVSLAGKAAVELYHAETVANGCYADIERAFQAIRENISENGTAGFGMIDVATNRFPETSECLNARGEAVVHAELERYMLKTRDILLKNKEFLEETAKALLEKETLLYSDIQAIRNSVKITDVYV